MFNDKALGFEFGHCDGSSGAGVIHHEPRGTSSFIANQTMNRGRIDCVIIYRMSRMVSSYRGSKWMLGLKRRVKEAIFTCAEGEEETTWSNPRLGEEQFRETWAANDGCPELRHTD